MGSLGFHSIFADRSVLKTEKKWETKMFNQRHSPMKRHIILSIENLSVLKECYAKSSQN